MKRIGSVLVLLALTVILAGSAAWSQEKEPPKEVKDLKAVVQGNDAFAFDLYAKLREKPGNVVFSPYSISTALAMTYAGARDKTAEKMAKTMHFTLPPERLHTAFGELIGDLQKDDKKRPYDLFIANALWGQEGVPFKKEFLDLTRTNYQANLEEVDFIKDKEKALRTINGWVEEHTKNKIKDLMPPDSVDRDTRLVLTNAIYMKALWEHPFDRKRTEQKPFDVSATQKVTVPMMHEDDHDLRFGYYEGDGFQWLRLPYKGQRLSMMVLLPLKRGQLADAEKTLTPAVIENGVHKLTNLPGNLTIPRFKMNSAFNLTQTLEQMGLAKTDPFVAMTSTKLYIQVIVHKAFIEVNETGTEAAAATGVVKKALSARINPPPFNFNADHPFLFVILDNQTESILFLGRVNDPSVK